jgi:hypothetical protein
MARRFSSYSLLICIVYKSVTSQKQFFIYGIVIRGWTPTKIFASNTMAALTMWEGNKGYVIYKVVSFN